MEHLKIYSDTLEHRLNDERVTLIATSFNLYLFDVPYQLLLADCSHTIAPAKLVGK